MGKLVDYLVEAALPEGAGATLCEVEHLAVLVRWHLHLVIALQLRGTTRREIQFKFNQVKRKTFWKRIRRTDGKSSTTSAAEKEALGVTIWKSRWVGVGIVLGNGGLASKGIGLWTLGRWWWWWGRMLRSCADAQWYLRGHGHGHEDVSQYGFLNECGISA